MSDVQRHRKEFHRPRYLPVLSATVIEVGDLMYWDSANNVAKPVSAFTYGSSLGETQKSIAPKFLGASNSRSRNGDTDLIEIQASGIKEYVCASATFAIGDLVGVDDNVGGTALTDQQVIAVTNPDKAIGRVAKRYGSATTNVEIELFPNILEHPKSDEIVWEHIITSGEDAAGLVDFDTGWGASPGAILVQVKDTSNANESHDFVITKLTGADLGKVRIADGYSDALDATDILTVTVKRYANS